MKPLLLYSLLCICIVTILCSCGLGDNKKIPSLRETYSKTDKNPFGSFVAEQGLANIFKEYRIMENRVPFDKDWYYDHIHLKDENYSLYFLITKNLVLKEDEVNTLIDYVKDGNDLFISADYIDPTLLEDIFSTINRTGEILNEVKGNMKETHVSIDFGKTIQGSEYSYYYFPFLNFIENYSEDFTRVLGNNENGQPNYAVFFVGTGRVYLHLAPRAFSNYFLLTGNNYDYFENVISYVRLYPGKIYWDEYYKNSSSALKNHKDNSRDAEKAFSSLQVIKNNPPLRWAFGLALTGLILFVLFKVKRKQRMIHEIKPPGNATVEFTETIGRLYFQNKNNRRIADKMITYFNEQIRNKYFLNTRVVNDEFMNSLAGKSGVAIDEVAALFAHIQMIQTQDNITDDELIALNLKIDHFNKNK